MYRGKVTAVDASGVYVQTAEYGTLGPCQAVVANYAVDDMVLCVNVGDEASPELVVVGRLTTTTSSATVGDDGVVTVTGSLTPVMRFDNASSIAAKNSVGTYEQFLWPRWSDNVMYLNYGSGGWTIRNSGSSSRFFASNAGRWTVMVPGEGVEYGSSGPRDMAGSGSPEGAISAPIGSVWRRTDGGVGTSVYIKESGTGNTGWVAHKRLAAGTGTTGASGLAVSFGFTFPATPVIVASLTSYTANAQVLVSSPSTTGCTIVAYTISTGFNLSGVGVSWMALG